MQEKVKLTCPNCKNLSTDLQTIRCPRCFTPLLKAGCQGNCSKCAIKGKECS